MVAGPPEGQEFACQLSREVVQVSGLDGWRRLHSVDYTYDAEGRLESQHRATEISETTEVEHWTYDAQGRIHEIRIDSNGDGRVELVRSFAYPSDTEEVETHRGPVPAEETTWVAHRWFVGETLQRERTDTDGNGTWDRDEIVELAEDGTELGRTRDLDGDGEVDVAISRVLDADGQVVETRTEDHRNGTVQVRLLFWRDDGRLERAEHDDGDGIPETVIEYAYPSESLHRSTTFRSAGDARVDEYVYASERLVEHRWRTGSGPWSVLAFSFDPWGNRTDERQDANGDGTWDNWTSWSYACGASPVEPDAP